MLEDFRTRSRDGDDHSTRRQVQEALSRLLQARSGGDRQHRLIRERDLVQRHDQRLRRDRSSRLLTDQYALMVDRDDTLET